MIGSIFQAELEKDPEVEAEKTEEERKKEEMEELERYGLVGWKEPEEEESTKVTEYEIKSDNSLQSEGEEEQKDTGDLDKMISGLPTIKDEKQDNKISDIQSENIKIEDPMKPKKSKKEKKSRFKKILIKTDNRTDSMFVKESEELEKESNDCTEGDMDSIDQ